MKYIYNSEDGRGWVEMDEHDLRPIHSEDLGQKLSRFY